LYKRYITRNGRRYGPYYYKSVRSGDIVKSIYVSKASTKPTKSKQSKSSMRKRRK